MLDEEKDDTQTDNEISAEEIEVEVEGKVGFEDNSDEVIEEEDTSKKHEISKPSGDNMNRSAGRVIANLGNEKKAIAEKLVKLAKSGEEARSSVKEMLSADPSTETYIKTKFGDDYDLIMGDTPIAGTEKEDREIDLEKIRAQERAKAQAEAIKEAIAENREKMLLEKAEKLGFTSEEFEVFKHKVELLGGGETAMEDAALLVNRKKALARTGEYADGDGETTSPPSGKKVITITPGLNQLIEDSLLDKKEFALKLNRVKELHNKDGQGRTTMSLPRLK